ncbi:MAG: hypothetical protein IJ679_00290 [Lachnospiraceae bacterium]|nr:hypothetical protein [Lachnospiraceae bacterium]
MMWSKMAKRYGSIFLSATLLLSIFSGCGAAAPAEKTMETEQAEKAEEWGGTAEDGESATGKTEDGESETEEAGDTESAAEEVDAQAPQGGVVKVESKGEKTVPFYQGDAANIGEKTVQFFNGNDSVAYMEVGELFSILRDMQQARNPDYSYDFGYEGSTFRVERDNGSTVYIDFEEGEMDFNDLYLFDRAPEAICATDVVSDDVWQRNEDGSVKTGKDGEKLVNLLSRVDEENNFGRSGYPLVLILEDYHIPIYFEDEKGYLPIATFNDLFVSPTTEGFLVYNEERLFLMGEDGLESDVEDGDGKTLQDIYYDIKPSELTPELAAFNYWELVLFLSGNYGLRDEHNIDSGFDEYLEITGLKEKLLSTDPTTVDDALAELVYGYFGDLHSIIRSASPYAGEDRSYAVTISEDGGRVENTVNVAGSIREYLDIFRQFYMTRMGTDCMDEEGVPVPYMEVGNTAYITFDHFTARDDLDFYSKKVEKHLEKYIGEDIRALVVYANRQITRENSPIENVVIDLSCNQGGTADVAVYISAWILGTANFSVVIPKTKAQYSVGYQADVNLDGKITKEDALDLQKYKVYCLESPVSFSCGNLLPNLFKESGKVTLIGHTSGGGACMVASTVCADGTFLNISGMKALATVKNGSYYLIDQGVEPDVPITDVKNYFDREKLTEYINGLM